MRLTYDLDADRLIRGLRSPVQLEMIELKSRTSRGIEWAFVRPLLYSESLHASVVLKFGIKTIGAQDGDFLASNFIASAWTHTSTGSGATAVYSTPITFDSEEMRTLLADQDYVDFAGVLKIIEPAGDREALNFTVRIWRTYIDDLEGFGEDPNPDPDDFAFRTVAEAYRIKTDGSFQLWNPDTEQFHTLTLSGLAGAEQLSIGAGED